MPEEEERERLAKVIRQWNNNRLDLFEISQPDEVSHLTGLINRMISLFVFGLFSEQLPIPQF